jgi:ribosomal protein S18 acetylase RimI-like enzyme
LRAVIRPATVGDASAVLALWELARSQAATTPDSEDAVVRLVERDPGALVVAEHGGELVGTLIAAWDGWRGNLYRLAVAPGHRRRGIGRRLVEAGEERLRALGARRVTALVGRPDERAAGFWDAVGYPYDPAVERRVRNLPAERAG